MSLDTLTVVFSPILTKDWLFKMSGDLLFEGQTSVKPGRESEPVTAKEDLEHLGETSSPELGSPGLEGTQVTLTSNRLLSIANSFFPSKPEPPSSETVSILACLICRELDVLS